MNSIKKVSSKIAISASPEEVFRAVTNWESQSEWVLATKVRGVVDESHRLGGEIEAFTGIGSLGFLDTMTITKWNPPHLCEVTHTGKTVRGSGVFEVTSENGMTYFTWTEYTEIPFGIVGKIGWVFVAPVAKLGLMLSLRRFRKMF
jgi:uncharacterized protein YndB with AHSA1/START domain